MPDRHGPYRQIRFLLEIEGVAKAGFRTCRLPAASSDVIEYREGNDPNRPRRLAGLNRGGTLVLKTGVAADTMELFEWRKLVEQGKVDDARRRIAVVLLDEEGEAGARWEMARAWPRRYEGPPLEATGKDVAVESLEVVVEELERVQ